MAEMVKIKIKFLKASLPYMAGEEAWFDEVNAANYIRQGFAERVKDAPPYVPALRG
jgi:hypothetical protein